MYNKNYFFLLLLRKQLVFVIVYAILLPWFIRTVDAFLTKALFRPEIESGFYRRFFEEGKVLFLKRGKKKGIEEEWNLFFH